MKVEKKRMLFAALAALLPGDVIHDVAPSSAHKQTSSERIAALDAARLKRMRKAQKRAKDAKR